MGDDIAEHDVASVARAICVAHGFDPDEQVPDAHAVDKDRLVPRWLLMRQQARTQIAAFKACRVLYG